MTITGKKRIKKIDLESIPNILEKAVSIIDHEITLLSSKSVLTIEDSKLLISYVDTLKDVYRDYRAQVAAIQADLKKKSPEEILQLVRAEAK